MLIKDTQSLFSLAKFQKINSTNFSVTVNKLKVKQD